MSINVSEAYREEFEVFICKYQQLCDKIMDLVVDNVPIDELITHCRRKHPDVMRRLTGTRDPLECHKHVDGHQDGGARRRVMGACYKARTLC